MEAVACEEVTFEVEVIPVSEEQLCMMIDMEELDISKGELFVAPAAPDETSTTLAWLGAILLMTILMTTFCFLVDKDTIEYFIGESGLLFANYEFTDALLDYPSCNLEMGLVFLSLIVYNFVVLSLMLMVDLSLETLEALKISSFVMHVALLLIWIVTFAEFVL